MRSEGTAVRYRGSIVVPSDDVCLCRFEAMSEAVVADANRRAGLACDRIVAAVAVSPRGRD
jgi:hypothetical protein